MQVVLNMVSAPDALGQHGSWAMPENVQCQNCGFLAIRNIQTRQLMEVEIDIRSGHKWPVRKEGFGSATHDVEIYELRPICFRMVEEFEDNLGSIEMDDVNDFNLIIRNTRKCERFTEWKQGWTPKEHLEMQINDRLLANQQKWQSGQEALADKRHLQTMIIAICGTAIGAFATVLAGWASQKDPLPMPAPVVNLVMPEHKIAEEAKAATSPAIISPSSEANPASVNETPRNTLGPEDAEPQK